MKHLRKYSTKFCWVLERNDVIMKNFRKLFYRIIKNKQLTHNLRLTLSFNSKGLVACSLRVFLFFYRFPIFITSFCHFILYGLDIYVRSFFNYSVIWLPFIHFTNVQQKIALLTCILFSFLFTGKHL